MKNFFARPSQSTTTNYEAAAAEGTWAYHTVKHQQSFHFNDCMTQLFKEIFLDSDVAKKFASARTKMASINTGVLASYTQKSCYLTLVPSPFQSRLMPPITMKLNYLRLLSGSSVLKLELTYVFLIYD